MKGFNDLRKKVYTLLKQIIINPPSPSTYSIEKPKIGQLKFSFISSLLLSCTAVYSFRFIFFIDVLQKICMLKKGED